MATHEHHAGHGGADHPAVGAILMSLSTIVVALNAPTARRVDLRPNQA
jgi:cation transport ATPase